MTWTKASIGTVAWSQVQARSVTTYDQVDFELQVRSAGPVLLSADRPLLLVSAFTEGWP